MFIIVNHQKLREALVVAERIVNRHVSLPILQNFVFKTEQGRLKVLATNLEIGISYWLGAKIEEEGEIALPARLLTEFINNIESEKVTLQTKDQVLTINTEKYKTKIIGFPAHDFPIIPQTKTEPLVSLSGEDLTGMFLRVIESSSLSDNRPELSGVFLKLGYQELEAAATDSFRLAESRLAAKAKTEISLIIPRTTVQEVIRIFANQAAKEVAIFYDENQIFFKTEDWEMVSRLVDGHYPDYQKIIPEKIISRLKVNKEELEKSIRLASIFSSTVADLRIQGEERGLRILSKNSERGEFNALIEGELKGDPFSLSLNFRYLLEGLKNVSTKMAVWEFTGEGSPLILHSDRQDGFLYLIMPLRN